MSRSTWITRLNLSSLDRDSFISVKNMSEEKVALVSQWRREGPILPHKLDLSIE